MYLGMNGVVRGGRKGGEGMYGRMFRVMMKVIVDGVLMMVLKWGIEGGGMGRMVWEVMGMMWELKVLRNKKEVVEVKKGI